MVLGGQPTPFFYNRIRKKQFFTLPVVDDNEIMRSTSDGEDRSSMGMDGSGAPF